MLAQKVEEQITNGNESSQIGPSEEYHIVPNDTAEVAKK